MALTEAFTLSAVTVGATELSIVTGTTTLVSAAGTDGVYQLVLDCANMAKADEYRVRMYESALSGGTKRVANVWSLLGVQSELFVTPTFLLFHKWDFTLQKIAGTDRAFTASIRGVT